MFSYIYILSINNKFIQFFMQHYKKFYVGHFYPNGPLQGEVHPAYQLDFLIHHIHVEAIALATFHRYALFQRDI